MVDQTELYTKLQCQRVIKNLGLLKFRVIAGAAAPKDSSCLGTLAVSNNPVNVESVEGPPKVRKSSKKERQIDEKRKPLRPNDMQRI